MVVDAIGEIAEIEWQGRTIRLCYKPRYAFEIDHVEIRALDKEALPITETGYLSHFFGPAEPPLMLGEVTEMVIGWLDQEATSRHWRATQEAKRQLSLF